jgi:HPt (histidine-containing phosphotransfer) domain-containing protein
MVEIAQLFLQDTAEGLRLLRGQVEKGERWAAGRTLHGLKGSCRQIGGFVMGDILEQMEGYVEIGCMDDVRACLAGLESSFESLCASIENVIGKHVICAESAALAEGQSGD